MARLSPGRPLAQAGLRLPRLTPRRAGFLLLALLLLMGVVMGRRWAAARREDVLRRASRAQLERMATERRPDALVLMYLGERQVQEGQYALGLDTLARAMQLDATNPRPRITLARQVYLVFGLKPAVTTLEEYLTIYPGTPPIVAARHALYAREAIPRAVFGSAEREANAALALQPGDTEARIVLAQAWLGQRRYDRAERLCQELLHESSDRAEAWLTLGEARLGEARTPAQIASARQALVEADRLRTLLPPDSRSRPLEGIGQCDLLSGDASAAAAALVQAVAIAPERPGALYALAQARRQQGRTQEAARLLRRHGALVRRNIELGQALLQARNQPDDVDAQLRLARLYVALGNRRSALRTYQAMIVRGVGREQARAGLAQLGKSP